MIKSFSLFFIFCHFSGAVLAVNDEIIQLNQQMKETTDGIKKMELINRLATAYYEIDLDSAERYAQMSYDYGLEHHHPLIYSNGLHQLGVVAEKRGHIEEAMAYLIQGLHIRDSLGNNKKIASSNLSLGNIHIGLGSDYEREDLLDEADQNFLKAKQFYQTALQYALPSGDSLVIYTAYNNLGFAYDRLFQYKNSIDHYELSLQWAPYAKKEQKTALVRLQILSAKSDSGIVTKTDLAEEYEILAKSFEKRDELENLIHCNSSFAYMILDIDEDLAETYLLRADSLAKTYSSPNYLAICNLELYEFYKEHDDYERALGYYELHTKYSNQIQNADSKSKFDELLIKYETEKTEKALIQEKSNKNKWRLALVISLILFIALVTFFLQRQRINRLKQKEEKDRYSQEVNNLIKNQELASVEAMLKGQDTERQRISQDLHDRLGSTLAAAKMYFEIDNPDTTHKQSIKAIELVDMAIKETRDIAQNLVSGVLSKFGLEVALNDLKDTIEGAGKIKINIIFNSQVERLKSDVEIHLYRIIQEIFSNAMKHSTANLFEIEFNQNHHEFMLKVSDNGQGFDLLKVKHGMGLNNIKARISKLNGSVDIDSGNTGTVFNINFKITDFES